ncbi:MgtC/SapB transporter [Methylobacterium sp. 4-46]|uniref:MgtC/SapB family protein n=1 Tax=unclassified Methylobacterium TaxID=2615210 RepID=UPI000152D100|nr:MULTISPECIES: MgtC/SapB family protein [Methylobacterium]ACA20825.1 MgtC/SapB transporter [Methylobacterium sp. 4-46]WFT79980.1 MgtC/SapB family protein [Methylobacterium nodulans]
MAAFQAFQPGAFVDSALSLLVAFLLGTLIGAERQYRQRTAGLRTNVLVAVGAAAFVDLGMVIMKEGMNVRGLNTAATLWGSAAVGAYSGADLLGEAVLVAGAVLAGNTLLRPLVNAINRIPIDERSTEATYEVRLTTEGDALGRTRDLLTERLEGANYPVSEVTVEEPAEGEVELVATLVSTAVDPAELDAVVVSLERAPGVRHATWTARTVD